MGRGRTTSTSSTSTSASTPATPAQLEELVAALRRRGKPLVFTVHDLRNPHHPDRAAHDRHLDVLVPAADALITLTQGAAAEIRAPVGPRGDRACRTPTS